MKLESQDLPGKKERVQQQFAEKQEQWERLSRQLSAVERAREFEGNPIKKMEYDENVNELEKERETVDRRLTTLESILREINRLEGEESLVAQNLLTETATWGISRINAMAVWDLYDARGADVTIGLLDTGVDPSHPDLLGKISAWAEFDRDGYEVTDSQPHDNEIHGTHAAGVLLGGNASGHWIGVAPEAKLAVAKVMDKASGTDAQASGTDAQVLAGLEWAIKQGVDVILVNLGGYSPAADVEDDNYTSSLTTSLMAGIPVVAPIGNEGNQTTGSPGDNFFTFAVGATDIRDRAAAFSGGRTHIIRKSEYFRPDDLPLFYSKPEVSAPGVAIQSSIPNGQWAAFNGTAMAAPHVAGVIALLLSGTSIRQAIRQEQEQPERQKTFLIQDIITSSVEDLGEAGQDHRYGYGRVDALRAIKAAREQGY